MRTYEVWVVGRLAFRVQANKRSEAVEQIARLRQSPGVSETTLAVLGIVLRYQRKPPALVHYVVDSDGELVYGLPLVEDADDLWRCLVELEGLAQDKDLDSNIRILSARGYQVKSVLFADGYLQEQLF